MQMIKEFVGEYEVVYRGELIVCQKKTIKLELSDEDLIMNIEFIDDPKHNGDVIKTINGKELTLTFYGLNIDNLLSGLFEPLEIGKFDDGKTMFFSYVIHSEYLQDGNLLFKYAFWKK